MPHRQRRRRGLRRRQPKPVRIEKIPNADKFIPIPESMEEPINIDSAELEALRLVDWMVYPKKMQARRWESLEELSGDYFKLREKSRLKPFLKGEL
jgi:hypothetical protein